LISEVQDLAIEDALNLAAETNAGVRQSADCKKGIAGFLNGEEINW